jgi:hypothetical protein
MTTRWFSMISTQQIWTDIKMLNYLLSYDVYFILGRHSTFCLKNASTNDSTNPQCLIIIFIFLCSWKYVFKILNIWFEEFLSCDKFIFFNNFDYKLTTHAFVICEDNHSDVRIFVLLLSQYDYRIVNLCSLDLHQWPNVSSNHYLFMKYSWKLNCRWWQLHIFLLQ